MRAEIKLLHSRLGVTSIFVTHDQEEALSISDRIAVMRQGRVEQYGTPEEVYARPATTYVARFIGSPPMDILHGRDRFGERHPDLSRGRGRFPALAADVQSLTLRCVCARHRSRGPLRACSARRARRWRRGDRTGSPAARTVNCRHRELGWWGAHGASAGYSRRANRGGSRTAPRPRRGCSSSTGSRGYGSASEANSDRRGTGVARPQSVQRV
jgi:hypothetical protein